MAPAITKTRRLLARRSAGLTKKPIASGPVAERAAEQDLAGREHHLHPSSAPRRIVEGGVVEAPRRAGRRATVLSEPPVKLAGGIYL